MKKATKNQSTDQAEKKTENSPNPLTDDAADKISEKETQDTGE